MLCTTCNDNIYKDDDLKCSTCNGYFHSGCVQFKETTFPKKKKKSCVKCKFNNDSKTKSPTMNIKKGNEANSNVLTNESESFINLTDSINFMSGKFDTFGNQLQELLQSMKDLREENKIFN